MHSSPGDSATLRRRGFTLVEMLAVIAIIGLLIGLLLPAVQAAREGSRRSQCSGNLKLLATAMENYHNANGFLPTNSATNTCDNGNCSQERAVHNKFWETDGCGWSLLTKVLAAMGQAPLQDALDLKRDVKLPEHLSALSNARISTLICPSDPDEAMTTAGSSWFVSPTGGIVSNYVGSVGDGTLLSETQGFSREGSNTLYGCGGCNGSPSGNFAFYDASAFTADCPRATYGFGSGPNVRGMFNGWRSIVCQYGQTLPQPPIITFTKVRDGLSNTIMLGHAVRITRKNRVWWDGYEGAYAATSLPINFNLAPSRAQGSRYLGPSGVEQWRLMGFSSEHSGICPVAMADGSVRNIRIDINQRTFNALGSRDGGEIALP